VENIVAIHADAFLGGDQILDVLMLVPRYCCSNVVPDAKVRLRRIAPRNPTHPPNFLGSKNSRGLPNPQEQMGRWLIDLKDDHSDEIAITLKCVKFGPGYETVRLPTILFLYSLARWVCFSKSSHFRVPLGLPFIYYDGRVTNWRVSIIGLVLRHCVFWLLPKM
jgi:hypothetical protein